MSGKKRLSASVDAELLDAAQQAVAAGRVESVSAWVNDALRRQAQHERGLAALDEFIAAYEAEHGEITEEDMLEAERWARASTIVVTDGEAYEPSKGDRGAP
jgi:Arc/MetJ-type ribon-helix-helix transcriptional regulator